MYFSIHRDKFAIVLINVVVKSYLAAVEPRIQDCSAYALQEILSIYNIIEAREDERSLWNKFPDNTQEILIPLLSSKYVEFNYYESILQIVARSF